VQELSGESYQMEEIFQSGTAQPLKLRKKSKKILSILGFAKQWGK
jgi:hypothetical protein